jgi:hypothetical protein
VCTHPYTHIHTRTYKYTHLACPPLIPAGPAVDGLQERAAGGAQIGREDGAWVVVLLCFSVCVSAYIIVGIYIIHTSAQLPTRRHTHIYNIKMNIYGPGISAKKVPMAYT